jgi:hypothetical protein
MERSEPTHSELQAIEAEWPVIEAELAVVDAEIAAARAGDGMTELDRRRVRRDTARLTRQIVVNAAVESSFLLGGMPRSGKSFAAGRLVDGSFGGAA